MSLPSNIQGSLEDQYELSEPDYDLWEEGRQHDELEDEQRIKRGEALTQEVQEEILKSLRKGKK